MSWSLVQSAVSNAPTQTGTAAGNLTATATISPTTPGNVMVICSIEQSTGATSNATLTSIVGGGTWQTEGSWGNASASPVWKARGVFSFLKVASTFSGSVTVTYNFSSTAGSRTDTIQFVILEFSGVTSSATYLDGGDSNLGSNGIPDPGALFSTANNELVVTGYTGITTTSGVPTGFSAGPSLSGISFAGMAYILNAPSSQTAAWSSGTQVRWGAGAHSLFGKSGSPVNFGSIIGA